jgi:hypothetical protein
MTASKKPMPRLKTPLTTSGATTRLRAVCLALATACALTACGNLPTTAIREPLRVAATPDSELTCRLLKASVCAYDVSLRSYDAASHSTKLERCEGRTELQLSPQLAQTKTPPPYAYLSPGGTNAFLLLQTAQDEIVLAFRGTVGLNAGLLGYLDWLNNFQSARVSDEWLGNVHFGFHNALFNRASNDNVWEALWRVLMRLRAENALAGKKLYITGHSKGGALAVLAAARLQKEFGITATAVYTYEAPRAGTADFARRYAELGIPTFRFENRGDIVPHLPPEAGESEILAALGLPPLTVSWWDPYVHVGRLGFIDWDGTLRFPDETAEFARQRAHGFVENLLRGDSRGVLSEELRAKLQFNHRVLPGGPSYFDVLCNAPKTP